VTTYRVGQVLYVVLRKEARVYPMQVVEEITKKTLEGEVTAYMVRGGTGADQTLSMADIDGEVFDSADRVRRTLTERATAGINQRVEQAVEKAKEWYVGGFEATADDPLTLVKKQPPVPSNRGKKEHRTPAPEVAELAAELQADSAVIELPDGTRAKVKSVKLPPVLQG
jgi:hypothetical protein